MRLHRGVGDLGGVVMLLADEGCIGEALLQVPELVVVLLLDVVWLALVDPISRRLHRLQRIEPRRERVVVHLNQLQRFLGDFGAGGSDRGDVVADVAHPIECKDTLVVPDGQDAVGIGRVAAGCDRFDARQRFRFRGIDGPDARVRMRRVQDLAEEHSRRNKVVGVFTQAGHFSRGVGHGERLADHRVWRHVSAPYRGGFRGFARLRALDRKLH